MVPSDSAQQPSWATIYHTPPPVKEPYNPTNALEDLPGVSYALELFLASHMVESEEYCHKSDELKERLYFATGYGLIQCVKGLMSYADEDLLSAIGHTKHGNHIAGQHRKKAGFIGSILGSTGLTSSTSFIKSMTDVERHAELVFAESLFEKALLGIVYSGDWLAFIKEALNMRTTIGIYRQLGAFLDEVDAAYTASLGSETSDASSTVAPSSTSASNTASLPSTSTSSTSSLSDTASTATTSTQTSSSSSRKPQKRLEDPAVDRHFRSGVYLGVGMCNIILSLMPGKLATLVELFGYKGDRTLGLEMLMRAGGWDNEGGDEPRVGTAQEGVRRSICDMALLIFHLVLSSFTVDGVDISVATRVLEWNLKRYPNGVFFLFGAGRLSLHRSQPRQAIAYYTKAMASQMQYRNLDHISYWEVAIARLALWEVGETVKGETLLEKVTVQEGAKMDTLEAEQRNGAKAPEDSTTTPVGGSAACWRVLEQEATWSKAIYSYGHAVCLLEEWDTDDDTPEGRKRKADRLKEAAKLMARVPGVRQKIAGKSIPLEKYVARKARKFASQNNRLALPALEIAYIFQAIAHAPRGVIVGKMLPLVRAQLAKLSQYSDGADVSASSPSSSSFPSVTSPTSLLRRKKSNVNKDVKLDPGKYEGGAGEYWDDLCLSRFLEGVCLRFVAYPDPDAILDPSETVEIPKEEAEKGAEEALRAVLEHGPKIELDHHLVYYAHYELGRLLACQGHVEAARTEFELVISGKYLEVGPSGRKGKYSMENVLHIRTHAALDALSSSRKT